MIIDISEYQGAPDWKKLAPALDFIILRSSIGVRADEEYGWNVMGCMTYNVPFHAFHYLKATTEAAARTEAKVMADATAGTKPLFYVIDAEYSGIKASKARAICEAFEAGLRHYIGPDIRVAVYIGHHLYKSWALDYGRYAYVWIPRYGENSGDPEIKPDWPCDLWQYTSNGRAPGISGRVDVDLLTGTKPLGFFTGEKETGDTRGGDTVGTYDKYILSTGTHYISNSGKDENNTYHGGQAGDQSGHEWELKAWYSRPWTVVLRWPDPDVGLKMAELGCAAALNNKIGYDQYQRTTYWTQLQKAGYDPSKITTACEEDCTAGVTANCKAAGCLLNIPGLKDLAIDTYSGNMKSRFVKAGFKALTDSKYLTGAKYLLPGDVLLYEGHHAAMNVTYGSKVRPSAATPAPTAPATAPEILLSKGDKGSDVREMQRLLLKWDPGCLPKYGADGDFGSETKKAVQSFQAEQGMEATGAYDRDTKNALIVKTNSITLGTDEPAAAPIEYTEEPVYRVEITGGSVNVRAAPSLTAKVLGVAHAGDVLAYGGARQTEPERTWLLVEFEGQNGWVSDRYAEVIE